MASKRGEKNTVQINGNSYRVMNYAVEDIPPLAQANRSGPLTYSDRQGEDTVSQATWHQGFGRGEIRASVGFTRSLDVQDAGRHHYSQNVDPRFRGQLILSPLLSSTAWDVFAEAKVQFIEFNGTYFAIGARYVHYRSGTTWFLDKDMGASAAAVKGCATVFGGNLYVCDGNTLLLKRNTAATWSTAATFTTPKLAQTVGTTIWVVSNLNQLQSSTDGTTFATAISVGSSVDTATCLLDYNGFPHIGKPDGFFFYDGQNLWNVMPEIAYRKKSTNCQGGTVARGVAYLPVGPQVVGYSADLIVPDVLNSKPDRAQATDARGAFLEFWPDSDFLWGLMKAQSNNYYITTYDFNPEPGHGWHQVVKTGTTAVTAIGVQATATPTLYYSEGTTIKYFLLAQNSVNPYADTAYRYAASGDIYLSQEADDFDDVQKEFISCVLDTANCSVNRTVVIKYTVDAAAEATLATITTNGAQEVFFPAGTTGKRISLHLTLATNDSTLTPQVFPIARRFKRRFQNVRRWKLGIVASQRGSPQVPQDSLVQYTNLLTARNTTAAVAFVDIDGTSYTAFVEEVVDATDPTAQSVEREKVIHVTLSQRRTS